MTFGGLPRNRTTLVAGIHDFAPDAVIIDPVSSLLHETTDSPHTHRMLTRLVDVLKSRQISGMLTQLVGGDRPDLDRSLTAISSIVDTWLHVRNIEQNGERNRALYVLKSRGVAHSKLRSRPNSPRSDCGSQGDLEFARSEMARRDEDLRRTECQRRGARRESSS